LSSISHRFIIPRCSRHLSWFATGLRCIWVAETSTKHRWTSLWRIRMIGPFSILFISPFFLIWKSLFLFHFPSNPFISLFLSLSSLACVHAVLCIWIYFSFSYILYLYILFSYHLSYCALSLQVSEFPSLQRDTSLKECKGICILYCEYCVMFIINVQLTLCESAPRRCRYYYILQRFEHKDWTIRKKISHVLEARNVFIE